MDPISTVSGGIAITEGVLQFLGYLRGVKNANMISAMFDPDGNRTDGSDKIEVVRLPGTRPDIWWFTVKEVEGYTFVRFPVIQSPTEELAASLDGAVNADVRVWRWIHRARQGTIIDGGTPSSNIRVPFIVVGYRPKALLEYFATSR